MTVIEVCMPDGSIWEVPGDVVARHRARWCIKDPRLGQLTPEQELMTYEAEVHRGLRDPRLLLEWAEGSMSWADVRVDASMARDPTYVDQYEVGWRTGYKRMVERL